MSGTRPDRFARTAITGCAVSLLALTAGACAADRYDYGYAPPAAYKNGYAYDRRDNLYDNRYAGAPATDRYAGPLTHERRSFYGIDGARVAHRMYSDSYAERYDGNCERSVSIAWGETLSEIAEYCDVPLAALIAHNRGLGNPRTIPAGARVDIPVVTGDVYEGLHRYRPVSYGGAGDRHGWLDERNGEIYYRVRPGDTLAAIAERYYVPLSAIAYLNPRVNPYRLEIGSTIRLPDYARVAYDQRRDRRYPDYSLDRPMLSLSSPWGARGRDLRLSGAGFTPDTDLYLLVGPTENELVRLRTVRADRGGRLAEVVRVPDAYDHDTAVFVVRNGDGRYARSESFELANRPARRSTHGAAPVNHVVREGETLAWISARYGVSMTELAEYNPAVRWGELRVGQRLELPPTSQRYYGRERYRHDYDVRRPAVLSALERSIHPGEEVTLAGEAFPPNTKVALYAGESRDDLRQVGEARTDRNGVFVADAPLPYSVRYESVVFVAAAKRSDRQVASERVYVDGRRGGWDRHDRYREDYRDRDWRDGYDRYDDNERWYRRNTTYNWTGGVGLGGGAGAEASPVAISGVLSAADAYCPTLRDSAGNVFALVGDLKGFQTGDSVLVRGAMDRGVGNCGHADSIRVTRVETSVQ